MKSYALTVLSEAKVAASAGALEKARALERHFSDRFRYTLDSRRTK